MRVELSQLETDECLTLDEAKLHARVDINDDDDWIESKIIAARQYVENYIDSAVIPQTLIAYYDACEVLCLKRAFRLPRVPVITIGSVKYYDSENTETEMDAADYFKSGDRIALADNVYWPTELRKVDALKIEFVAGFGEESEEDEEAAYTQTVPENIKLAMGLLIGHWYQNREAIYDPLAKFEPQKDNISHGVSALLMPYRRFSL
jgi:uncharacterized phiE125 gp8 family phage protein